MKSATILSRSKINSFGSSSFEDYDSASIAAYIIGPQLVAGGRYIVCPDGPERSRAEVAFLVLDQYQGRGTGALLLRHLAIIAKAQGIHEFLADVLADNQRVTRVFERSGFHVTRATDLGVARFVLLIAAEPLVPPEMKLR